jgi:hypothetical protein
MLEQAYRVIRTLEKAFALMIYTGYLTRGGKEAMCPFCKARTFQKIEHKNKRKGGVISTSFSQVLKHDVDCEIIRLLEEMEEWGCKP